MCSILFTKVCDSYTYSSMGNMYNVQFETFCMFCEDKYHRYTGIFSWTWMQKEALYTYHKMHNKMDQNNQGGNTSPWSVFCTLFFFPSVHATVLSSDRFIKTMFTLCCIIWGRGSLFALTRAHNFLEVTWHRVRPMVFSIYIYLCCLLHLTEWG